MRAIRIWSIHCRMCPHGLPAELPAARRLDTRQPGDEESREVPARCSSSGAGQTIFTGTRASPRLLPSRMRSAR